LKRILLTLSLINNIICLSQERDTILKIPIVFHIIDNQITDGDIPDGEFYKLINSLNKNFGEPISTYISPLYFPKAGNPKIEFFIPSSSEKGDRVDPITWTHTNRKFYKFSSDNPLNDVRHPNLENNNYINVYLVRIDSEKGSVKGYYKPSTINQEEGVVLDWSLLFRPQQDITGQPNSVTKDGVMVNNPMAFTLAHEIGHFFNLKHTWGDKALVYNGCNYQTQIVFGDFVEDTPTQPGPNIAYNKDRFNPITKIWTPLPNCGTSTPSNYQNFMDQGYGVPNGYGMFTTGQIQRMRMNILNRRVDLLWRPNNSIGNNNGSTSLSGILTDTRDRQRYKWVQIGNTKWMTKNLNYNSPKSVCYDNKDYNCKIYGRLYNWEEANNMCPKGWRLANSQDWKEVILYLNNNKSVTSTKKWFANSDTDINKLNLFASGKKGPTNIGGGFGGLGSKAYYWQANNYKPNSNKSQGSSLFINGRIDRLSNNSPSFVREKLSCRCVQDI